jgi:hypothetical protein
MSFRNRKGMFGLVIFAGCDHKCRFRMFSPKFPGATNDSLAWPLTDFCIRNVSAGLIPEGYFIACDEAVTADEVVLTPYGGRGLGPWRDSFNYHLSAMRQCIERAFGIYIRRWGIFWRPLIFHHSRWSLVCSVCAKLHNLCIDFEVTRPPVFGDEGGHIEVMPEDEDDEDDGTPVLNRYESENLGEWPENADNSSVYRNKITSWLRDNQFRRPAHSSYTKA